MDVTTTTPTPMNSPINEKYKENDCMFNPMYYSARDIKYIKRNSPTIRRSIPINKKDLEFMLEDILNEECENSSHFRIFKIDMN